MPKVLIVVLAAIGCGALTGAAALLGLRSLTEAQLSAATLQPRWSEVAWPFAGDEWGRGRAFVCKAADCGVETAVYIRAKIGFCNCATGVSDDEELERIGDLHLVGGGRSALDTGHAIQVSTMKGRMRPYAVSGAAAKSVLAAAFNDRCDVVVATALVGHARPAALQKPVLEFLNGPEVLRWAEVTLGL